jgi:hypothetical protein
VSLAAGVAAGATGVFFHSICRLEWWTPEQRAEIVAGVKQVFDELAAPPWQAVEKRAAFFNTACYSPEMK